MSSSSSEKDVDVAIRRCEDASELFASSADGDWDLEGGSPSLDNPWFKPWVILECSVNVEDGREGASEFLDIEDEEKGCIVVGRWPFVRWSGVKDTLQGDEVPETDVSKDEDERW